MVFFQAVITTLLPFFLLFLIMIFWIIYAYVKKLGLPKIQEKLIATFIITIFSMQPTIINYLFNMISCKEIPDLGKSFIQTYLTVECFNDYHYSWIMKLFIPSFCFYGVLLPLAAFSYMKYYACFLHDIKHIKRVGFLSNGYRRKKFYWEFFFFYRKIGIIFISEFFVWSVGTKALLVLMILFISLWYQARDNPFITEDLNSLDFQATVFSFCTLLSGLFTFDLQNSIAAMIFMLLIFLLNFFFLYVWMRRMLVLNKDIFYKPKLRKIFGCFLPYLDRLQEEFNPIQNEAFMSLSYFNQKNKKPEMTKKSKGSIFNNFRKGLSKVASPDYSTNKSNKIKSTKRISINEKNVEMLKTETTPEKELLVDNLGKSVTENFSETKIKRVTFQKARDMEEDSSDRHKLVEDSSKTAEQNEQKSKFHVKSIRKKNSTQSNSNEKKKASLTYEEENKILKEIIQMKDEHIKSLYEEIKNLHKELILQKKEVDEAYANMKNLNNIRPKKIQDINHFISKQNANYLRSSNELGCFVEKIELNLQKFKELFLQNQPFEIVTPLFSIFVETDNTKKRTKYDSNCFFKNFIFIFKNFQNSSKLDYVLFQSSKNLIINQRKYEPALYERNPSIEVKIEKIIRFSEKNPSFLTIESFIIVPGSHVQKFDIILPLPNWVFLDSSISKENYSQISEEIQRKLIISQEFTLESMDVSHITLKDIKKLFPLLEFQYDKLVGILNFIIEGTECQKILMEVMRKVDEKCLVVELYLMQNFDNEVKEEFLKNFKEWLLQNFLQNFFIERITLNS